MKKDTLSLRVILLGAAFIACSFFLAGAVAAGAASSEKAAPAAAGASSEKASVARTLPLLVDVGADKCIPCKMMAPTLEELKRDYAGVLEVRFVDIWKSPDEAGKYRVTGIPTQIFYDASGKELTRHMGYITKNGILKTFEQAGVPLKKPARK